MWFSTKGSSALNIFLFLMDGGRHRVGSGVQNNEFKINYILIELTVINKNVI